MKIKIKPERWNYLKPVSGMTLDVETDFLFGNQFNTVPVPGVSESGYRVMLTDVEEVINDFRIGRMRCNYCGKHSTIDEVCHYCAQTGYLERFGGRYFPTPTRNEDVTPKEYRSIPDTKKYCRGGILLHNRGMGCAGDSWDNPTHAFSVVYGPKRSNGDYSVYTSLTAFYKDEAIGAATKSWTRRMVDAWAKEMGY